MIGGGYFHGCGLLQSREVGCWGFESLNSQGQLAAPAGRFTALGAGGLQTCGVRAGGSVECWGGVRELHEGKVPPRPDVGFPGGEFVSVSVGGAHACGLRPSGEAVCWGVDWFGQADAPEGPFAQVDAGLSHSCGLRRDGSAVCWGQDSYDAAELIYLGFEFGGDEEAYREHLSDRAGSVVSPKFPPLLDLADAVPEAEVRQEMARRAEVWLAPAGPFIAISAGYGFSCGLRVDGDAVCWGFYSREEPRIPLEVYAEVYGPRLWDFHDTTKAQIDAGDFHSFDPRFHSLYESLYGTRVWELDPQEQSILGPGAIPLESLMADLRLVDEPPGPFIAVEAGWRRACGLRPTGHIECWGIEFDDSDPPPGPFATKPIVDG